MRQILKIILKIFQRTLSLMLALIFTVCFSSILFFSINKSHSLAGYSFFIVGSSSMEPQYPINSLIIVKRESFSSLNIGDVIVFRSEALNGQLAFHRIIVATPDGFFTKGDNNYHGDNQLITNENYISKGVKKIRFLGSYLVIIQTPLGFVVAFLLPTLLFLAIPLAAKKIKYREKEL